MREGAETTDENLLIERASHGDAQAFNELMSLHQRRMYAVALRMCAAKEDAEDCLQEAMLRVYRSIGSFKAQSAFGTWVYRITVNTCLDELRRRKSRPTASLDGLLDEGWSPADGGDGPEQRTVRREQRRMLEVLIAELPEDMRAAIVLRDIQGLSYDDISAALGVNVGTIKSRISRGRERLREKIQGRPELFDMRRV